MRVLILPSNNSLSHLAKGLAVRKALAARGHEVEIAVSSARAPFLASLGIPHHVLPDLQEADGGPAPSYAWFRQPDRFLQVVQQERSLLARVRPDRVLGIFRFTCTTSAALEGVPCDTLACGCMVPQFRGVLGFGADDPEAGTQGAFLEAFYTRTAGRLAGALTALGRPPVRDIRDLLLGRRTYLWDSPSFQPLEPSSAMEHVGPIAFDGWPSNAGDARILDQIRAPLAVLSMGTALSPDSAPERILRHLLDMGFQVAIAGGGIPPGGMPDPRVAVFQFAPMARLLERASLLVCQGGQLTIFEAMALRVPVAVLPFHPEQAQNGLCLERLGAGRRLVPPTLFWGASHVYREAFDRVGDADLRASLETLVSLRPPAPESFTLPAAPHIAARLEA